MTKKSVLTSELQKLVRGVLLPSETDSEIEVVEFPGGENDYANPTLFRKLAKIPTRTRMESRSGYGFFDPYSTEQVTDTASVRKMRAKLKLLSEFFDQRLADVVVHRCGTNKIKTFVIGRTNTGDAIGISATQVET